MVSNPEDTVMATEIRPIEGAAAWTGGDLAKRGDSRVLLNASDIQELDRALVHAKAHGVTIGDMESGLFPLDELANKLLRIADRIECGPGFAHLEGFPLTRWSPEDGALVWIGLASHIGTPVF